MIQNKTKANPLPYPEKSGGLLIILFFSFLLRVWGVDFGLPYFIRSDESRYLEAAYAMLSSFDFNPHYFYNPPFLTYLYVAALAVYHGLWKLFSLFLTLPEFGELYIMDRTSFFVLGRVISAVLGTFSLVVLYRTAKNLFQKETALIAAALLGFSFLHARNSHYAVNDIAAVCLALLAFYSVTCIWKSDNSYQLKHYMLAGFWSGLAVAAKYNTGIIVFVFLLCVYLRKPQERRGIIHFFLFCFLGFFISCPWILLDAQSFFPDFLGQITFSKSPWPGAGGELSLIQFVKTLLWGYGVLPFALSFVGAFLLWKEDKNKLFLIAVFPAVYTVFLAASKLYFVRFAIPALPFLSLLSAHAFFTIYKKLNLDWRKMRSLFALLLVMGQGILFTVRHNILISQTDSRVLARSWIIENVAPENKLAVDFMYTPPLEAFGREALEKKYLYETKTVRAEDRNMDALKNEGYSYMITSSFFRPRYEQNPGKHVQANLFYHRLEDESSLVFESDHCADKIPFYLDEVYSPFWNVLLLKSPGPCIKIYEFEKGI